MCQCSYLYSWCEAELILQWNTTEISWAFKTATSEQTSFPPWDYISRSTLQQTKSQLGFLKDSLSRDVWRRLDGPCEWRHTSAQLFCWRTEGGVLSCVPSVLRSVCRAGFQGNSRAFAPSLRSEPCWYGNTTARALIFTKNNSVKHAVPSCLFKATGPFL